LEFGPRPLFRGVGPEVAPDLEFGVALAAERQDALLVAVPDDRQGVARLGAGGELLPAGLVGLLVGRDRAGARRQVIRNESGGKRQQTRKQTEVHRPSPMRGPERSKPLGRNRL